MFSSAGELHVLLRPAPAPRGATAYYILYTVTYYNILAYQI